MPNVKKQLSDDKIQQLEVDILSTEPHHYDHQFTDCDTKSVITGL